LDPAELSDVAFREDCTWTPKGLIFAALLWTWSDEKTLTERFFLARKVVAALGILPRLPATSYRPVSSSAPWKGSDLQRVRFPPGNWSLQPVAIGAAAEVTKPSKPSRQRAALAARRAGRPQRE
jgi:hypothetical protein